MNTDFLVVNIDKDKFKHLFHIEESELSEIGAIKDIVKNKPGYPCRISLEDAEIGEEVILFPYVHHDTKSPYQSTGPVYIRKDVDNANLEMNETPKMLSNRLLSLRGYNNIGIMLEALTIQGKEIQSCIQEIFSNNSVSYIHVHNASPGCFNCKIIRS